MYGAHKELMGQIRPDMYGHIRSAFTWCVHDHHQTWVLFSLSTCGFASIDGRRMFNDDGL